MSGEHKKYRCLHRGTAGAKMAQKSPNSNYHYVSAVKEVEVADPIASQEFPDFHQTVALL